MADEQQKQEAPDRSPEAKDKAIAKLAEAQPGIHFDTAWGILRGDPAFDPDDPDERIYIMNHWRASISQPEVKKPEKKQEHRKE